MEEKPQKPMLSTSNTLTGRPIQFGAPRWRATPPRWVRLTQRESTERRAGVPVDSTKAHRSTMCVTVRFGSKTLGSTVWCASQFPRGFLSCLSIGEWRPPLCRQQSSGLVSTAKTEPQTESEESGFSRVSPVLAPYREPDRVVEHHASVRKCYRYLDN